LRENAAMFSWGLKEVARRRLEAEKLQRKADEIFASDDQTAAEMIFAGKPDSANKNKNEN